VRVVDEPGALPDRAEMDDPDSQRAHFDSAEMVEMAAGLPRPAGAPRRRCDLYEPISAHDLH